MMGAKGAWIQPNDWVMEPICGGITKLVAQYWWEGTQDGEGRRCELAKPGFGGESGLKAVPGDAPNDLRACAD